MPKSQRIERCIGCGCQINPLIRENQEKWEGLRTFIIEKPTISKNKFIELLTSRIMVHDEADIIYFLCSDCCRDVLKQLLTQLLQGIAGFCFGILIRLERN